MKTCVGMDTWAVAPPPGHEGQNQVLKAQMNLKAYRVEFIGLLTEYPGTDNWKGEHQNALVML